MTPEPDLREADFSRYIQGLPYWQIPLRRPLWFVHKARRGLVPGDEPTDRLGGRIIEVARRVAREHPGEPAALVSHADGQPNVTANSGSYDGASLAELVRRRGLGGGGGRSGHTAERTNVWARWVTTPAPPPEPRTRVSY